MHLSKATVRNNGTYIVVDAVVDGVLQVEFVSYSGNTVEHENAATDYLLRCGLSFDDIEFDEYEIENSQEFVDGDDAFENIHNAYHVILGGALKGHVVVAEKNRPTVDLPELNKFFS